MEPGVFVGPYNPIVMNTEGGADALLSFFSIGEQNIGKLLLQEVQAAAPKQYLQMVEENRSGRR